MLARSLDDLVVYRKSLAASDAVFAILRRERTRMERDLHGQLASASAAVAANIAEGFGQQSDRQFVRYLYIARGSAQEVRAHCAIALGRGCVTESEKVELSRQYEEIVRMLTGLIKYLRVSDRKQRG